MLPFIISLILASILSPTVDYLSSKCKLVRWLASLLITIIFFLIIFISILLITPVLYKQLFEIITQLNSYGSNVVNKMILFLISWMNDIAPAFASKIQNGLNDIFSQVLYYFGSLLTKIIQSGIVAINTLSLIFITPIITYYLLQNWVKLKLLMLEMIPQRYQEEAKSISCDINKAVVGFFRGQLYVCSIMGLYYTISFSIIHLDYCFALGIMSGLLIFIPYVGAIFSVILCVLIAVLQFGISYQITVIGIIFLIGQILEGVFITPKFIGKNIGLHPVWIIFAIFAAGSIFGFLGILFAVPLAAIIAVLVKHGVKKYKNSEFYNTNK